MTYPRPAPQALPFTYPHELPPSCVFYLDMQDGLAAVTSNNMIPLANCKFGGWTSYLGETITVAQGQEIPGITDDATRIQGAGNGSSIYKYYLAGTIFINDVQYTTSVYIYVPSNKLAVIVRNNYVNQTVLPGESKRVNLTSRSIGVSPNFGFAAQNIGDALDFYVWHPMINVGTPLPYEPGYIPSRGTLVTDHANFARRWTNTGGVWVPSLNLLAWQGDGVDDKISYGADLVGVGDVTFEAVFRATGWGGNGGGRIIDNGHFRVNVSSVNSAIAVASASGQGSVSTPNNSIELNKTYYVVVTRRSDGKTSIYLNGKLSGDADRASSIPSVGTSTNICNRAVNDRAWAGTINMAALYKGIWSAQDVAARYAEIAALYGLAA